MESITVDELKKKIVDTNPVNIVDVRTREETAMGIIPGAKTIPMNEIPSNLSYFNENETYYLVCKAGVRSERTGQYLEENGINVVNVEGGMDAWGDDGLEVDSI